MKDNFFLLEKEIRRIDQKLVIQFKDFISKLLQTYNTNEVKIVVEELYVLNLKHREIDKEFFIKYFPIAQLVVNTSNISILSDWTKKIRTLFELSPDIALSYINSTRKFLEFSKANYLIRWGELGFSLHKGSWQSNILVSVFFEESSRLIKYFEIWDLENIIGIVDVLFLRSYDVALDFLRIVEEMTKRMNREKFYLPSILRAISLNHWHILMGICEKLPNTVNIIHSKHRNIFMKIFEKLCLEKEGQLHLFLDDVDALFTKYKEEEQRIILDFLMEISKKDCLAITDFLTNLESLIDRIRLHNLSNWVELGISKLDQNKESGKAFFRIETLESKQTIDLLSSMVELETIQPLMKFYCTALSGLDVQIRNSESLVEKSIGWEESSLASTEGSNVYLPSVGNQFSSKIENFMWYKVLATHQVGHIEFGSFKFEMSKPSLLFKKNIRNNLLTTKKKLETKSNVEQSIDINVVDSQVGIFLRYFENSQIALDIFTALEEGRIDRLVLKQYKGLYSSYKSISTKAIKNRKDIKTLPLVELIIEGIIRISLGDIGKLRVPKEYLNDAKKIFKLTKILLDFSASVEDVAETTIRIYSILIKWPNEIFNYENSVEVEVSDLNSETELKELDEFDDIPSFGNDTNEDNPNLGEYESPENVDFRGEFKPEIVEILENIKNINDENIETVELKQQLEDVVQKTIDMENGNPVDMNIDDLVQNLLEEAKTQDQSNSLNKEDDTFNNQNTDIKTLQSKEPGTYIYPEWDFRVFDYKPDWCLVREKIAELGEQSFFDDVLKNYRSLFNGIMKQFELVITEGLRKEKKLPDGDHIDIDEVVQMVVDRKNRVPFSDRVYWRRNKVERDVAVALLLDISASTAEAIDNYTSSPGSLIKPHGTDYKAWIGEQTDHKQTNYKRIIDLEKESIVLLINALEKIGDQYGIYGFSGYGRENVEYYVVKDFEESFSNVIKQRLDKLAPLHATRMGPSIRHTITKLNNIQAKTKILMLLSDGRPQDRGYSREGVQKEYAVFDTHMALVEAKKLGIIPFCLTIDKTGHDYLGQMCGDIGYEIVENIWTLPKKLPLLYKRISI